MKQLSDEQMAAIRKKISKRNVDTSAVEALHGRSEDDIKKAIEAGDDISEYSLGLIMKVILGEFSADILLSMINNGYEFDYGADCLIAIGIIIGKLPESLIYTITDRGYCLAEDADFMLIRETVNGRLPERVLRYMLEKKYEFSNIGWEAIFESGIDFMVDAYMKEFHPDVKY